jgi:DUF971 family protein
VSDNWPRELQLRNKGTALYVDFDNGSFAEIPAELLRVESPSAEVKGHGPGQETLVWGKRRVAIMSVELVGNYAARLIFSDGHSTGIYTWDYLAMLGRDQEKLMLDYNTKIAAAGLQR